MARGEPAATQRFGKYVVDRRLGAGGMAEVYVARLEGPHGFEKVVALKRMRCNPDNQKSFSERFVREARVAALLQHPNIGQVFDFGSVDDELYIAMELIDGVDLVTLLNAASAAGTPIPIGVAVAIAIDMLSALEFAHNATSPDGKPLQLVHRDVSPSNLLVSYSGHTKLIDFGITRVADDVPTTQTGQVVGKFRYMSPEQALGETLDGRSDVFAAGIVMWELVAGRPLFDGPSGAAVLQRIVNQTADRPSTHREIPPELDDIVIGCLARERAERVQSAGAVCSALEALARDSKLDTSADAVAQFLDRVVPRGAPKAPAAEGDAATVALRKSSRPATDETVAQRPARGAASSPSARSDSDSSPAPSTKDEAPAAHGPALSTSPSVPRDAQWWWTPAATGAVLVIGALVWFGLLRSTDDPARTAEQPAEPRPVAAAPSPAEPPHETTTAAIVPAPSSTDEPATEARPDAGVARRPTARRPAKQPPPVDDGTIAIELDLDSNPTGAEVILKQDGATGYGPRSTALCKTPCRQTIRVPPTSRFWVELRRDGCDGGSARTVASKARSLRWRIDLAPVPGGTCTRDRHTAKAVARELRRLKIAPCFAPAGPGDYQAELTLAEDGTATRVRVSLGSPVAADLASRKATVESCIAEQIQRHSFIPAREPGTLRVPVDL